MPERLSSRNWNYEFTACQRGWWPGSGRSRRKPRVKPPTHHPRGYPWAPSAEVSSRPRLLPAKTGAARMRAGAGPGPGAGLGDARGLGGLFPPPSAQRSRLRGSHLEGRRGGRVPPPQQPGRPSPGRAWREARLCASR